MVMKELSCHKMGTAEMVEQVAQVTVFMPCPANPATVPGMRRGG